MIKVSVIVPVYNVEDYLEKCLLSLQNQTLKEIEIIVVDDGSKDHSFEIMKQFQEKDSRFKIYQKENGGLSDARNFGMERVSGEYIVFIDSDDYVDEAMFEEMYECAKREDADVVECDFIWEYPNKQKIDSSKLRDSKNPFLDIRVLACNKIYRNSFLKRIGITFLKGYRYEDVSFCYKYFPYVKKISTVPKPFYHYIQREKSIINTQNEKVLDILVEWDHILEFYKKEGLYETYKERLEYVCMRYLLGSSFLRAIQIPEKKLRNKVLKKSYQYLNETFPNWKKNIYLKEKTIKNFYYRNMNSFLYYLSAKIFRMIKR